MIVVIVVAVVVEKVVVAVVIIILFALLNLAATYYDNRADFKTGETISEIPTGTKNILQGFKTMYI